MDAGKVYWITGLSGAGKTTIGRLVYERLRAQKDNVVFLDGDILREVFGNDLSHSREDRFKSAMRNARLCKLLSAQGIDVVCATISLFNECQQWNRANIPHYIEIFLDVPLHVLQQRDPKGIYRASTNGQDSNVVGINIPHEAPLDPDFVIVNDGSEESYVLADRLLAQFASARKDTNGNSTR